MAAVLVYAGGENGPVFAPEPVYFDARAFAGHTAEGRRELVEAYGGYQSEAAFRSCGIRYVQTLIEASGELDVWPVAGAGPTLPGHRQPESAPSNTPITLSPQTAVTGLARAFYVEQALRFDLMDQTYARETKTKLRRGRLRGAPSELQVQGQHHDLPGRHADSPEERDLRAHIHATVDGFLATHQYSNERNGIPVTRLFHNYLRKFNMPDWLLYERRLLAATIKKRQTAQTSHLRLRLMLS